MAKSDGLKIFYQHKSLKFYTNLELSPQRKENIVSLVIEAASALDSYPYVAKLLGLIEGDSINILVYNYIKNFYGRFLTLDGEDLILNHQKLLHEGPLLSTAFHEFSHVYDYRAGLMPTHLKMKNYWEDFKKQHPWVKNEDPQELSNKTQLFESFYIGCSKETIHSEIMAYSRELDYMRTITERDWGGPGEYNEHMSLVMNRLECNKYLSKA